jgi:multicomponent Na+:H+ antiporter subunit D
VNLDVDWVYRKALPAAVASLGASLARGRAALQGAALGAVERTVQLVRGHHAPPGALGDPWSIGSTALWAALLLVAYLLMAFL